MISSLFTSMISCPLVGFQNCSQKMRSMVLLVRSEVKPNPMVTKILQMHSSSTSLIKSERTSICLFASPQSVMHSDLELECSQESLVAHLLIGSSSGLLTLSLMYLQDSSKKLNSHPTKSEMQLVPTCPMFIFLLERPTKNSSLLREDTTIPLQHPSWS